MSFMTEGKPDCRLPQSIQQRGASGAGLEEVRFKDLRRTFATWRVFRKVAPKALQKWMGYKSIETTMRYYVVSPDDYEQEEMKR